MTLLQAKISAVDHRLGLWVESDARLLEQAKIMTTSFAVCQRDDFITRFINPYLCLEGAALFLAGVAGTLLFWGRSTGVCVASISVSSHHLIVRKAVLSLTP
jgi:hypothetical protein